MISQAESLKILLVEDEAADRRTFERVAEKTDSYNIELTTCERPVAAEELLSREKFDVLFLDNRLPKRDGLSFFRELQANDAMIPPAIMLTGYGNEDLVSEWYRLGGSEYLPKEDLEVDTLTEILEVLKAPDRTKNLDGHRSLRDPVTDLHNRRFLMNYLGVIAEDNQPSTGPLALLLIHFDGLRHVEGPEAENERLKQVGSILREYVCLHGRCGRYDGDRFWTVLRNISRSKVTEKGARVLGTVQKYLKQHSQSSANTQSNVAGIMTRDIEEVSGLIENANNSLDRARSIPGNTVLLREW